MAARYGIEQVCESVDAICDAAGIDSVACIIFWTPPDEPVVQLLRAGKHVIVEKPLAGRTPPLVPAGHARRDLVLVAEMACSHPTPS